ncbi:MAG: hypothetical protein IJD43_00345 [Thermoguttaceae bacterium]|nr:glycosyltransferase family 4 protein [Planctomycetaceae bacterium]MBQ4141908.1 hypothetical protein [Thermoguttaceae bacterium]
MANVGIYQQCWGKTDAEQRLVGLIAQILSEVHDVEIVHHEPELVSEEWGRRLGLDLRRTAFRYLEAPKTGVGTVGSVNVSSDHLEELSGRYDVFLNASDQPPIPNRAKCGILLTQFPQYDQETFYAEERSEEAAGWFRNWFGGGKRKEKRDWQRRFFSYHHYGCLSEYALQWCTKRWGLMPKILDPVIRKNGSAAEKTSSIAAMGRLELRNLDRLDMVINVFQDLCDRKFARVNLSPDEWTLELICSGAGEEAEECLRQLKMKAFGYRVRFHVDPDWETQEKILAEAKFFWYLRGFGVMEQDEPDKIGGTDLSVLLAQDAGALPLAFHAGGIAKVIRHEKSGILWEDYRELGDFTLALLLQKDYLPVFAEGARENAKLYGENEFRASLERFLRGVLEVKID